MSNFISRIMGTKKTINESANQPFAEALYCEQKCINHLNLLQYMQAKNVDTSEVGRLIYLYQKDTHLLMRWGVIYAACMDCGLFVPMEVSRFTILLKSLIYNLKVDRTSVSRGVKDFYDNMQLREQGKILAPDVLTFIKAKDTLETKLRALQ